MSNETKWTPGPWRYQHHSRPISGTAYHEIFTDTGSGFDDLIAHASSEANAHLIAAAPELYAMLERILEPYGREDVSDEQIEQLLAKARGE